MYETFDHTADLGLRVTAATPAALFAEAALALTATLVENPGDVRPDTSFAVSLPPDEWEFLLFDWLRLLLSRFESEHFLVARAEVTIDAGTGLAATVFGEALDRTRHFADHEVKAITYHDLKVEQSPDGWLAEVIVDI